MKDVRELKSITDEMLFGLTAGESLKRRVYAASSAQPARPSIWRNPARWGGIACTAAAVVITAVVALRPAAELPLHIDTHAAGGATAVPETLVRRADLPENSLQLSGASTAPGYKSLFAGSGANFSMVGVSSRAYRLLSSPTLGEGSLGSSLGTVGLRTDEPSLASGEDWQGGLSNVADEDSDIRSIAGVSDKTAIAAQVDGTWRIFQRVYYAGHGTMSDSLEGTLDVRGKVASLELSDVGTISDSQTANRLVATLLDNASLHAEDASSKSQSLTIHLNSGISFSLGVNGDVVSACGGWSCPEFFAAFNEAL